MRLNDAPAVLNRCAGYAGVSSDDQAQRKYSVRRLVFGGTWRSLSETAEKMVNLGSKSSPRFMIEATLPQR